MQVHGLCLANLQELANKIKPCIWQCMGLLPRETLELVAQLVLVLLSKKSCLLLKLWADVDALLVWSCHQLLHMLLIVSDSLRISHLSTSLVTVPPAKHLSLGLHDVCYRKCFTSAAIASAEPNDMRPICLLVSACIKRPLD